MNDCAIWCTTCGQRFSLDETKGVTTCCPACGSKSAPCHPDDDVRVEINWYELRMLGIWASNWADKHCSADGDKRAVKTLRGILSRLERQFPEQPPLTLAGELRQVRQAGFKVESSTVGDEGFVMVNGPGAVGHSKPPTDTQTGEDG